MGRDTTDGSLGPDLDDATPGPRGERVHHEPARSYAGLVLLAAVLLAGFLFDLSLGGAGAHAIGWVLASALILGLDAVIVHAARVSKSLTVTADEVWVGEEMVDRARIVAVTPGVDRALPVLGWPTGLARLKRGLTLRLDDDREVVVPTRKPERVRAALGLAAADPTVPAAVRPAADDEFALIAEIDDRAEVLFRIGGYELPRIDFDEAGLRDAAAVFVVGMPPLGFAQVDVVDGTAHLAEIAVLPSSMRRGLGSALLEHVCTWAAEGGYPSVTLTTYADVPWNGPWYARHGFVEIDPDTPELLARRQHQTQLGLDEPARRIVMQRDLTR